MNNSAYIAIIWPKWESKIEIHNSLRLNIYIFYVYGEPLITLQSAWAAISSAKISVLATTVGDPFEEPACVAGDPRYPAVPESAC